MADRYRNQQNERNRSFYDEDRGYGRQEEQFADNSRSQYGDDRGYRSYDDSDRGYVQTNTRNRSQMEQRGGMRRDYNPLDDYDRESSYREQTSGRHGQFRADSYGGEPMVGPETTRGGGSFFPQSGYERTERNYDRDTTGYRRGNRNERGFFDKAGDEIASWFGDESAEKRREMDHRGRGPKNYSRSNERILEDACDRLTDDRGIDASDIQVTVDNNEVTLDGKVNTRWEKRRAEDAMYDLSGVKHVQNNLRLHQTDMRRGTTELDTTTTES